ncbi:MAG: alpha/beta hydrolase [Cyanobacteria bacterium P01_D01_bin.123]
MSTLDVTWIKSDDSAVMEGNGVVQMVLLHGWGANARDLMPLAAELNLPGRAFGFPNAPLPHPNVPDGRAWYDIETGAGFEDSAKLLHEWLEHLPSQTGVPLSQTVLGGFSQGGAMTLRVGLTLPLAGLACLSGYLAGEPPRVRLASPTPPVLMAHGLQDPVIPVAAARQSRTAVEDLGGSVQYREYEMGHQIISAEMADLREFLLSLSVVAE